MLTLLLKLTLLTRMLLLSLQTQVHHWGVDLCVVLWAAVADPHLDAAAAAAVAAAADYRVYLFVTFFIGVVFCVFIFFVF